MHWIFYTSFVSVILNAYLAIISPELRSGYAGVCLGCTYLAYTACAHGQREKNASVGNWSKWIELLGSINVVQEMGKVRGAGWSYWSDGVLKNDASWLTFSVSVYSCSVMNFLSYPAGTNISPALKQTIARIPYHWRPHSPGSSKSCKEWPTTGKRIICKNIHLLACCR